MADAVDQVFDGSAPAWFTQTIRQGYPAEILIDESRGAEMLVVGSRGHGGFAGLLLGSVSTACAEHAHCPVLIMHDDR
jgi:nucleotide-binding universal stress UspA family protein